MKKGIWLLLGVIALLVFVYYKNDEETPVHSIAENKEVIGMWISYGELARLYDEADEATFRTRVITMYENCQSLQVNTVYVHASAFTDSFYPSDIYPPSQYYTERNYDPYAILLEEAHAKGIRFEAWINPLRSKGEGVMERTEEKWLIKQWVNEQQPYIRLVNGRWYLNPAYPQVIALVSETVQEILSQYPVDGIHIDDYFYPEGITEAFDCDAYAPYKELFSLAEYRRHNINNLVKTLYDTVKKHDDKLTFSVSPAGNLSYCYDEMYADVYTWLKEDGYADYLIPQLYFGYDHGTVPYLKQLQAWDELVKNGTKLVIGLAAYKINTVDGYAKTGKYEWQLDEDILARQMRDSKTIPHGIGYAYFSYDALFHPTSENADLVTKQLQAMKQKLNP